MPVPSSCAALVSATFSTSTVAIGGRAFCGKGASARAGSNREYFLNCHRYIEMNPVRGGLSLLPAAYRWSSHSANSGLGARHFLRPHCEYEALSDDAEKRLAIYRSLFDA